MIYDILIIGAGVAGLNAARLIPKELNCLIVCKDYPWECNTFYAQGGVATALNEGDIPIHIQDTLLSGANHCNKEAVEFLSTHSIECIKDIIDNGMMFDKDENGNFLYTKEAAHSNARIVHADGDATGRLLHMFLMQKNPHVMLYNSYVVDLLVEDGVCYGATVAKGKKLFNVYAKKIILASGGVGSLYEFHTNARSISADLQGIAIEKGIKLKDMEMMQFHPTVYVQNRWARKQLLTEALRGEGAYIVDEANHRFLFEYDQRGELAPRDIISRAIFDYKKRTSSEVFLSFDTFSEEFFRHRFPNIFRNLKSIGFNIPFDKIPISPAFHYSMGGIDVDLSAKVKGYKNLYAVGEVACTGVHGANRLASNSLLEGLVFSKVAIDNILNSQFSVKSKEFEVKEFLLQQANDKSIKCDLRRIMWEDVGIIRRRQNLLKAKEIVEDYLSQNTGRFLKLRLLSAKNIIDSAIARKESLGAHFIID
ncbi:MAG: FAD-binding protein [Campylobacterales bacterium]|nr:FAD-binding protein [Campylobacterales bacterium]